MTEIKYFLSVELQKRIQSRLIDWQQENVSTRLWHYDPTIWKEKPEENVELGDRLGWLVLPYTMREKINELTLFANETKNVFSDVLLLGMGGSSLAPEVFAKTFGSKDGFPSLSILDSTHPEVIKKIFSQYDLSKTLFIVASKSGGTAETMSFYYTFFEAVSKFNKNAGDQFIAITDPDSGLEKLAIEKKFRKIFSTPPDVGGRYSALTYFGMVPAALIGMDIESFIGNASSYADACGKNISSIENPGIKLGCTLGELALDKKDKLTFFSSKKIETFTSWIEQLVAESTGKENKGIIPITDENEVDIKYFSNDRVFVFLTLKEEQQHSELKHQLIKNHFPVISIEMENLYELSQQFYLWEIATAFAGAVLKINPFDQPDVQLAKTLANESLSAFKSNGSLPIDTPDFVESNLEIFYTAQIKVLKETLKEFFKLIKPGDYVAINAFIQYGDKVNEALNNFKKVIRDKYKVAVTIGYGPRFLHSTGQLHKGGTNNGLFIQITNEITDDINVPGKGYSFGTLITAQAQGDFKALAGRKRRAMKLNIKGNLLEGLNLLTQF